MHAGDIPQVIDEGLFLIIEFYTQIISSIARDSTLPFQPWQKLWSEAIITAHPGVIYIVFDWI